MEELLNRFRPITLDEMNGIRLMNRTDTKFLADMDKLRMLLELSLSSSSMPSMFLYIM